MTEDTPPPRVFISYSHDSEEHQFQVLALSNQLRTDGINCILDQYVLPSPEKSWPTWMENQIEEADFILLICTENYFRWFLKKENWGYGKGATWEGAILTQGLYDFSHRNRKFIPILFSEGQEEFIPTPLKAFTYYKIPYDYESLYRHLLHLPLVKSPPLGKIKTVESNLTKSPNFEDAFKESSKLLPSSESKEGSLEAASSSEQKLLQFYLSEATKSYRAAALEESLAYIKQGLIDLGNNPELLDLKKQIMESSIPLLISDLKIQNFKLYSELHLQFSRPLTLILGKNSYGKSSLLQAIAVALLPDYNRDLPKDLSSFLHFGEEKADLEIAWDNGFRKIIDLDEQQKSSSTFLYSIPLLLAYGPNVFTRYERQDYDDLAENMISGERRFYSTHSLFEDFSDEFCDPLLLLGKLDLMAEKIYPEQRVQILEILHFFQDTLNQLLQSNTNKDRIQIVKEEGRYLFQGFGQNHRSLRPLSEGYRSHVLILSDLLIKLISTRQHQKEQIDQEILIKNLAQKAKGVILIDEFDRHLHPDWQRNLLAKLRQTFPKLQFLLTTHNPMSVLGLDREEIRVLLRNDQGKIESHRLGQGTKNLDINTTLLTYFGMDSVVSLEMEEAINRYYELKLEGKTNLKEYQKLEERLELSSLDLPLHDYRYLLFLKFLRSKGVDPRSRVEKVDMTDEEFQQLQDEYADYL